jgi:hypothetical protein
VSDSESAKERADRILSEALDDASFDEGRTSYTWEDYFDGRIDVYWEGRSDGGINFVLNSMGGDGEELHCYLDLEPISQSIGSLFSNDDDAATAWEDLFHYLLSALGDVLLIVETSLERRSISLQPRSKKMQEEKMFHTKMNDPFVAELEARRLRLFKQLQGEYRRGGSDARHPVSDQQCAVLATDFPLLLKHWRRVRKWKRESSDKWREHSKLDFQDTPDDLLDRLDDKIPTESSEDYPGIPAVLALEHAARRCGLPANVYSYSTLKTLRRRGQAITGQIKKAN